jgi:hypothetical protein
MKTGIKARFTEPFPSFAPNTNKHYILRHCINIVFLQQYNHINRSTYLKLAMQLYNNPLFASFDIFCQQEVNWIYNKFSSI